MSEHNMFIELIRSLKNHGNTKWGTEHPSYGIFEWDNNGEFLNKYNITIKTKYCLWVGLNGVPLWKELIDSGHSEDELICDIIEFINYKNKELGNGKNFTILLIRDINSKRLVAQEHIE